MKGFESKTLIEISKLKLDWEKWENLDPTLCFKWTEDQEPPFPSHEVEIDLDRKQVEELVGILNKFLKETRPLEEKR